MFFNWAIFSMDVGDEYFTFKLSYAKLQVMLPITSIHHIIMNNLVVVLTVNCNQGMSICIL